METSPSAHGTRTGGRPRAADRPIEVDEVEAEVLQREEVVGVAREHLAEAEAEAEIRVSRAEADHGREAGCRNRDDQAGAEGIPHIREE